MSAMSMYAETIFKTRYARWDEGLMRRETYGEAVDRYINYFVTMLKERHNYAVPIEDQMRVRCSMLSMETMGSMRSFMAAGTALKSTEVANFNCAYLPLDSLEAFAEHMYVLMCSAGSGFSVERMNVSELPFIPRGHTASSEVIVVQDSRQGWCDAFLQLLKSLCAGEIPSWDVSLVRPEGARLKTFGGYASGPKPLIELFEYCVKIITGAGGRQLRPIEVFGIACYIAQIVVVGGVRRSATICLFDHDDHEMLNAKSGEWWKDNAHYAMANVSATFNVMPERDVFETFWSSLKNSGFGEPGLFNRQAVWIHNARHGRSNMDDNGALIMWGTNPCGEILLRPYSFCNLSAAAIRPDDSLTRLIDKVEVASILGTWQACVTQFEFLRPIWRENSERERLLGVCLTGIMDHAVLSNTSDRAKLWLQNLREAAIFENRDQARRIGIPVSHSVTSVKPSGNSGELYDVASGIHPRYSRQYIRTIRGSSGDPVTAFLKASGVPWEVSKQNERDTVFSFPIKVPAEAKIRADITAIQQLEHWLMVKDNYATHTVSCTIYVRPHEWDEVGDWVYIHFNDITGLSFLPYDDHKYEQAPIQPCTLEEYNAAVAAMPTEIDWDLLKHFEKVDTTTSSQERACVGGACEFPAE